jgi:hypothetical protein
MDTIDTTTTDLVVLDAENTLTDSDTDGTSTAAIGAVCLAAGVAIGTFVVPPVVGFVKGLFSKSETPEIVEEIAEIMTPTPKDKAAKAV